MDETKSSAMSSLFNVMGFSHHSCARPAELSVASCMTQALRHHALTSKDISEWSLALGRAVEGPGQPPRARQGNKAGRKRGLSRVRQEAQQASTLIFPLQRSAQMPLSQVAAPNPGLG